MIAYAMWMWIQLPWALSYDKHFEASILITKYVLLFYILYSVLNSDKDFFKFILFNILGGFYVSNSVLNYSAGGRVEGIGGPGMNDANTLGMHLSVVLIFASIMLLKKNSIFLNDLYWRICQGVVLVATLFIANAVVQTISRSAVLGLISGGIILILLNHKVFKKKFYLYLVIALIGLSYFAPYTFWERLDTISENISGDVTEGSAYSRFVIASAQLEMFYANPLGYGHRGTFVLSPHYLADEWLTSENGIRGRSSHCTFLTTLVEQGLPGALLYLLMVFWVIRTVLSFQKDDPAIYLYVMAVSASLAAIFVSGIFVDYLKVEIQVYCFAMLASLKDYQIRAQYEKSLVG